MKGIGDGSTALLRVHHFSLRPLFTAAAPSGGGDGGGVVTPAAASSSCPTVEKRVYVKAQRTRDPFLRDGTTTSRLFRAYRTQLPFPVRLFGVFLVGFSLGLVLEVFACKTHLYESVMMKKDARRHEFDEFVLDFRHNVERWQREDMSKRQVS
ncbi:hypothetical protein JKF63_07571 [Porcisia hertigi]|uniref:Uncharacterized protein n=1 Tax=Porcisia hertigi TaxID=2761500 RepID=A0A836LMA2_9TRYP|nr:hypothetical protein JKF63_07571 [Porcisia hertigi]